MNVPGFEPVGRDWFGVEAVSRGKIVTKSDFRRGRFVPGKNLQQNPKVNLNLNSNATGGDVVRAECAAEVVADAPRATEVGPYLEKYREGIERIGFDPDGFADAYSVAIRATPTRWQSW